VGESTVDCRLRCGRFRASDDDFGAHDDRDVTVNADCLYLSVEA
jgi:hypothetical protein